MKKYKNYRIGEKLKFILMIKELRNNIGQKLKIFFPSKFQIDLKLI